MALTQRLEIRQSHALVMTPQLMQAIKLLQLSNLDLATYVEGELERNPLLERDGDGDGEGAGERSAAEDSASADHDGAAADWAAGDRDANPGAADERADPGLDDIPPDDATAAAARAGAEGPAGYSDWGGKSSRPRQAGHY